MARHGLSPRKSLGQHFLLDPDLLARIVRAAGPLAGVRVIEVGPGPGGLTRALLASEAQSVVAVEIDPRAVAAIEALRGDHPERLRIIEADAMSLDLAGLVAAPRAIIANLPYNVGTGLLVDWLTQADSFQVMVLMFQAEVAQRIVAKAGDAAYGRLAVLAGLTMQADLVMHVPASAFVPPPKVESAVVRLLPRAEVPERAVLEVVARITACAFGQRRKMLRASLRAIDAVPLLEVAGIDPQRRAETVPPEAYLAMARHAMAVGHAIAKPGAGRQAPA
ncbi:16S rRNA (adenine1518-N6/adenine1519-N6)-dimethyltransferase [Acidiphilium sp. MT5]